MNRKMAFLVAVLCALTCPMAAFGQREQREPERSSRPEPSPERRISSRPAGDRRNSFGFSLGLLGWYDSNMLGGTPKEGLAAITPNPRVFFNLGTRKSLLHMDYRYFFRHYPKRHDLDSSNHEGTLEFIHQPSRHTTISVQDYARYGPNDILSFTSQGSILPSTGQQQIFFDLQKMWSNNFTGTVEHQFGRRHRIRFGAGSQIHRYRSQPTQDTNSFQAYMSDELQFTRRWSLSGEASNEWVNSASDARDGRILRLMGGIVYRPDQSWAFYLRAGNERTSSTSDSNAATYEASITRDTKRNLFGIRYNRRSGYQIGLDGLNRYHGINANFDQQLNSRVSIHLLTRLYRTDSGRRGTIDTIGAGTGFEIALHPNITTSVFGHYVYQKADLLLASQGIKTDRYIVYAGLYYMFPSAKRERRTSPSLTE